MTDDSVAEVLTDLARVSTDLKEASTGTQQLDALEKLALLAQKLPPIRVADAAQTIPLVKCFRDLLAGPSTLIRGAVLRTMRHFLRNPYFMNQCWKYKLDWWVTRSLDRQKAEKERMQAFRLVRALVDAIQFAGRAITEESELPRSKKETAEDNFGSFSLSFARVAAGTESFARVTASTESFASFARSTTGDSAHPVARLPEMPIGIVHRLVSVAETADDPLRRKCLIMLRDLAPYKPSVVSYTHGLRALLNASIDPTLGDLANSFVLTFLLLLDHHTTRKASRMQYDLQCIFIPFTQPLLKDSCESTAKMKAAQQTILAMMRSWTGLFCMANDPRGLKPLIDILRYPGPPVRKTLLLQLFFQAIINCAPHRKIPHHLLRQLSDPDNCKPKPDSPRAPVFAQSFTNEGGERVRHYGLSVGSLPETACIHFPWDTLDESSKKTHTPIHAGYNVLDTFLGALLLVYDQSGLIKTLISVVKTCEDLSVSKEAVHLLQLIFILCDTLFAKSASLSLHSAFDHLASEMLLSSTADGKSEDPMVVLKTSDRIQSLVTQLSHSLHNADKAIHRSFRVNNQLQMAFMDEIQFRNLVAESMILTTKDYTRWNADRILLIIRGPLRVHARLLEILKTKFFKRILSFMRPHKRLFSDLLYTEENFVWSNIGAHMIELLMLSSEGAKYFQESGLLLEISKCLQLEVTQLPGEQIRGTNKNMITVDRFFTKDRLASTMTREYFRFIGKLSQFVTGMGLMQAADLIQVLYQFTDEAVDRDDICQHMLKYIGFGQLDNASVNKYTGPLLENALIKGCKPNRYFATLQLRGCFQKEISPVTHWCIKLLVRQIADPFKDVALCAYQILHECCVLNPAVVDIIIDLKPDLEQLMAVNGQEVVFKMLRSPKGFEYLSSIGWLDKQLALWGADGCQVYCYMLENDIRSHIFPKAFSSTSGYDASSGAYTSGSSGVNCTLPSHLYGDLCSTREGVEYFKAKGAWDDLMHILESQRMRNHDAYDGDEWETGALDEEQGDDDHREYEHITNESANDFDVLDKNFLGYAGLAGAGDDSDSVRQGYMKMMMKDIDIKTMATMMDAKQNESGGLCQSNLSRRASMYRLSKALVVRSTLVIRATLWALGHIGSSDTGLQLLIESNMLDRLLDLGLFSEYFSLRGTMMGVLGLIARSDAGRTYLEKSCWSTHRNTKGYYGQGSATFSVCFAYPNNFSLWISTTRHKNSSPRNSPTRTSPGRNSPARGRTSPSRASTMWGRSGGSPRNMTSPRRTRDERQYRPTCPRLFTDAPSSKEPEFDLHKQAVKAVKNLSNPVLQDQASKELRTMRSKTPQVFQNPKVAADIHCLMSHYRYRANARRFLYDFIDSAIFGPEAFVALDEL